MSDKSIIVYSDPKKGIKVHDKRDAITIGLSIDESDKKEYFKTRVTELEETNRKLKDALNSLKPRRDELKYLKEFRTLFSGKCIVGDTQIITIIQCTERINKGQCNFHTKCKPRKRILERLEI